MTNIAGQSCGWDPLEVSEGTYTHYTDNWMTWMCSTLHTGYQDTPNTGTGNAKAQVRDCGWLWVAVGDRG